MTFPATVYDNTMHTGLIPFISKASNIFFESHSKGRPRRAALPRKVLEINKLGAITGALKEVLLEFLRQTQDNSSHLRHGRGR